MKRLHAFAVTGWALALALVVPACSSLLGLGDFKDAPADGGSAGGAAGIGGSAGTGGTSGTAGSAGGGAGGSAGVDAGGGAGGASGSAGSAGAAGSDAGSFGCALQSGAFSVLSTTDLDGMTVDHNGLFVIDGPLRTDGTPSETFVVLSSHSSTIPQRITVRALQDDVANRVRGMAEYEPASSLYIESGYADGNALYLLGRRGTGLVQIGFDITTGDPAPMPTEQTFAPSVCSDLRGACFAREGNAIHATLTCSAPGADGGTELTLIHDGNVVASGPGNDMSVRSCYHRGSTQVIQTGDDFGLTQLRVGSNLGELGVEHPLHFTSDSTRTSTLGMLALNPSGDSLVIMGVTYLTPPKYTPLDFYAGAVPLTAPQDLDQVPPPEVSKFATITAPADFIAYSRPDPRTGRVDVAGANPLSFDKVAFTAVGYDGKPLIFNYPVYQTDPQVSIVPVVATGAVGFSSVVVWQEQDTDGTNDRVRGQALFCH